MGIHTHMHAHKYIHILTLTNTLVLTFRSMLTHTSFYPFRNMSLTQAKAHTRKGTHRHRDEHTDRIHICAHIIHTCAVCGSYKHMYIVDTSTHTCVHTGKY